MSQLKSFWHDGKIVDDDVEMHSFEEIEETAPAMDVNSVEEPDIQRVISEMKAFRQEFLQILQEQPNDVRSFWLRKTKKPVLAVLLVQGENDKKGKLYRGTNMEVSMPTGSLCAERNVIGTALASDPALKRQDLKMVAVLAVPLPPPRMSSSEDLATRPADMPRSSSLASYSSVVKEGEEYEEDGWIVDDNKERMIRELTERTANLRSLDSSFVVADAIGTPPGTPYRRIMLTTREDTHRPSTMSSSRKHKRTVLVRSQEDMNPLKPCGACNEWLKKIAESNPYFQVITFTDTECNGVYCSPIQE
jgi:cytidine deaminase